MTYRQHLETCNDEFEKAIIIANLARKHPKYDSYSARRKKEVQKELLDCEMPIAESEGEGMTIEEAKKYAKNMTYREAICNLKQAKSVPYRKATFIKVNELLDELEQEPFMNKPCISSKVCEHDKEVALDKIDEVITDALDKSTDQKESQTLRWVLDKISEVT